MAVDNTEPTIGARNHNGTGTATARNIDMGPANPPPAARGGFDGNVHEVLEQALSQSEGQSARLSAGESKSYEQSLQNLILLQEDLKNWTCPPILINVAESLTSDVILQIDIAETLLGSGGHNVPQPEKRDNDNCYWFAEIFSKNTKEFRETEIVPEIKAACRAGGFTVNCKYRKMENENGCIEVKCCRGTFHSEEKNLAHNRKQKRAAKSNKAPKAIKKKSAKPVKGEDGNDMRCPFHFKIYWDETRSRWFLPKIQRGNRGHCGHPPIDPADIKLETKNCISPAEEEIAKDSMQSHISTGATQSLIIHHSSTYVVPSQSRSDNCRNDSEMPIGNVDFVNNNRESDKVDLTEAFRARYVVICNFAESAGDDGVVVMAKHFAHCQCRFLNFFNDSTTTEDDEVAPPKSGSTVYVRFNHPFQVICQMAQETGKAGIAAVSEALLACKQELVGLVDGKKLSKKKIDSRLKKVTSPPNVKSRKRPSQWLEA